MDNYYAKEFAEVVDVIDHSEIEIINKIPEKLYQFFKKYRDINYMVNIDYTNPNWDDTIREDSRGILAIIYRDYLVDPEIREELLKEEKEEEKRLEIELKEKYNTDNLFDRPVSNYEEKVIDESNKITKYREPFLIRIKNWFKNLFNR